MILKCLKIFKCYFNIQVDSNIRNEHFPERSVKLAKNYCRNPTRDIKGPWCYTMESSVINDSCDVLLCNFGGNIQSISKITCCQQRIIYILACPSCFSRDIFYILLSIYVILCLLDVARQLSKENILLANNLFQLYFI